MNLKKDVTNNYTILLQSYTKVLDSYIIFESLYFQSYTKVLDNYIIFESRETKSVQIVSPRSLPLCVPLNWTVT